MDPVWPQQQEKKQLLQQQQILLQKQLQQQHQQQQLLKQQQQQLNIQQQQCKQQQQQLKPQQQLLQTQQSSQQQQQPVLQAQPQYLQQQLSPNQQQLLIRNQDFLKQRGMQQGNLNQQQLLEHQTNQDQAIIELLQLHDNNEYEDKNQDDCYIVEPQQVIQQQQQPSLQRQQPLQQLQSQLLQQSHLGQQLQHQQQQQFLQQSQQQLQTGQQPQSVQKTQVERQPQVVRQPHPVQKSNSLQQPQNVQQQNNQYSPMSTQQQSKKQPPPHTQQLLQQQLQQLLLKNKNYPQRIVVLGNQQQQQQLSSQQPQRVVTNNGTGKQTQQMQCVVVSNTGQQPQQMQRVVVTGTGQQQQQQQVQRVVVGNNGQQQPQQMQRVVVPTTVTHQQMQRVVVTSTGQQIQQQQLQHVVIPGTSQQQSHQVHNVVSQTSNQQQPQQLQRVVVAPTGQQQVQRVVTSTSVQQQQQQHQPVPQRIVIGQLKTSQQTQQIESPSQNGVVLNQQVIQRPIGSKQQQQRVVIAGQQQILKLTNQQQSQQQIALQKQLAHKLLQPTSQQQQQDVVKNQQQQQLDVVNNHHQQDVVKIQQQQLDVVNNHHQQDVLKKQQQQQHFVKKQLLQVPHQQLQQGSVVPLTQQQKNNTELSNESLAKELHIKQSHQQLQQLHVQPSQKHSQEQINKQLQQQKLKQKKEIDQLQHQLKQPQRSGVIVGQLQQPEKPEPEKLKKQLEIQQQQRQKLHERILLQQRQQQQQQKKLKEQQQQQKHQQQLREQVLLQQHLKQQQQQQLQKKLLLRQQASSENRFSLVVNGIQDQKVQDEDKTTNRYEKSQEPEHSRYLEKATAAEKQYQLDITRKNNENVPVIEKELLSSSSSDYDDDDDDDTIRKQRNLLREAERLVQERYDALTVVLGSEYQAQYDDILRNWLASRLSREEFDHEIRKVMYVSWVDMMKNVDGDHNSKNESIKTKTTTTSKKTAKKKLVATISKIKEDTDFSINSTVHKSPTLKQVTEVNEDIDINIENKEAKAILAERVPLHNALVTSLIMWLPLNCQWLEQRKARSQGLSETGSPLRLYTYADVPQVRGPSDHWYPDVPGSLARWFWPNHLPCKSSLAENNKNPSLVKSFHEQEKKEIADAVAAAVLIKPPSRILLPLLMEIAENTETVRRTRQIQYQKKFPMKQNVKVMKILQWQRLQEQKRLATMIQLRDGCSKLLRELKIRLRYLANQEGRLIERLRRLQIRMSRRRRQVLAQFKIREQDLKSRIRKFFDRSYLEQTNNDSQEHLCTDGSNLEDDETDKDEKDNGEKPQYNFHRRNRKEVHLLEKNHNKNNQLKTTIDDHQSRLIVRAQPQSTALTIRLLRDRQRFLETTRLLQVIKQERLQIKSYADYVRDVRNKNCPCGESDNKPCQYRRQIRQLRKKLRARELAAIKEEIDRELVRKAAEKEKLDAEELQKTAAIEIEKKNAEIQKKKVVTKSTKKKKVAVARKNINVETAEKKTVATAKGKTIDNSPTRTNTTVNNSTSKKKASLVTTNMKNAETKVQQTLDNPVKVNKGKHNIGINCELLLNKSPQQTRHDSLGDTRNRIRPPLPKDKRSVVNVADAAARAAQAALAASKKTQLRKTRAAAAAAAAVAAAATATTASTVSSSGKFDNDRRASELMPPPPPPPLQPTASPKASTKPRNPTIGARYLQQQQLLLDRHRQLERIRRDEEERRQLAQDERQLQEQEYSDKEEDETNMNTDDVSNVSSLHLPPSQKMRSKRQKIQVDITRQDISREAKNEDQEDFSHVNRRKAKNVEEGRQLNDYYFYYGGADYYSSDEESSGSSFIEPPFPPLLHDLRIDQLPRPSNRLPAAAVLPPGVRTRLQPMRLSSSKIQDGESSASLRKPQVEKNLQERKINETGHGRNINEPVQSFDDSTEFSMHSNPLKSQTMTDKCNITKSAESPPYKKLATKIRNKLNKGLQTDLGERPGQQQMQHGIINDTKMSPVQRKRRQDAEKLPVAKKLFEEVHQERRKNAESIAKAHPLTEWSKRDLKQVTITSVTKTNSFIKDQPKYLNSQLKQQNSINKIMRSVSSNKGQEPDTRVDVEELRSVQWKAPLTQWNKRPVEYETIIKQRPLIQNKWNDLQHSMKEKVVTCSSAKFEVAKHHLNDRQQKLRSEIDRQKCERIKLQNMVFEYQKLVDTLPLNEQLQHMIRLQQHLRPSGNMIDKTTVKCNPSVKQQLQSVPSTNNSCILLDDSTSLLNLSDDSQEQTILKQISNLLLKIKHQQEEMYRNVVISDDIKCSSKVVSNKLDVNNVEQNDLKNWRDLWPAFEDKPNNDDLMDEEQRLHRTQELIDQYYSSNNDQKSVRSLDQQKRRLGRYGRERLERELPEYQNLRTKQIMQSEKSARSNLLEKLKTIKRQNLQHTQQHLPERQICLDHYKRLGRIEQLEQQKHILEHQQQQLKEQKIQKLKNKQQQNSGVEPDIIQQQRSQYCWTVSKFRVSPTLCYNKQLPLLEQLLRRIMKKKNVGINKINRQQQYPKSTTIPVTAPRHKIITPEDTSNEITMIQKSRGSQLWWMNIGLQRQISPLVSGVDNQADLELTPIKMMPIGNLPQVTRPQTDTKAASVIYIHQKSNTIFTNKKKFKKLMTPQLLKMMTNVEERWLEQLQTHISQLDQQVDLHWKTMMDRQQQQVKLLLNYDKHLQLEKAKKRLERERRIQQLRKRTPFQALPVHHQQTHTSRVVGHMRQQQSEIPIIIIDDDDESLNDTTVIGQKRNIHPHPVFIDDDLLKHKVETKVLYEDQHKGISNRWKQLEIIRKEHQKQWKLKIQKLFSYKATNRQFCRELNERLMKKINNPILITALEHLNGNELRYTERQQFQKQVQPSVSGPVQEPPRMLNRHQEPSQRQAVKNCSHQTLTEQKQYKTAMLSKKSKKMIKESRSTLQLASQQRPPNKKGEQKLRKQLLQNLNDPKNKQSKTLYEHQDTVNVRQLRSKRTIVVNQPSQKRTKQQNHQNQNKLQVQKKSPVEQEEQTTRSRFQRGKMLTKVKTPAVSSRHIFLLRNRILKVHSNRKKRLQKQIESSVPKQDVILDDREMQVQQYERKKESIKLTLRSLTYSLHNQRSMLQRQLDRLNETHPDKFDKLEPSVSKTILMSVQQPSITSLILPPLQPSNIKKQSLTSTVILSPERPLPSIEQSSKPSIMLTSQLPMRPNLPFASTSAVPCQEKQLVEEKRHALKQRLNFVHSKLKPLMEMWQLSLRMPGRWLCQQLDDIEQLKRKEFSVKSLLDLGRPSGQQHTLQNNEASVVMASTITNQCSLQQLQRIRDHLNWRQQRLRDLIEDLLILIFPEQHSMLSVTTREPSNCSVLIKLQQRPSTDEQINPTYSALLNLQSPSSSKQIQQQFSTYSMLLKLKQPMTAKQQSLMYSTLLKLQQPQSPTPKQTSCRRMMITTQQPSTSKLQRSIDLVSGNLIHNPMTSNNKLTHGPNYQLQEKRLLSSGNEKDDGCKRLKSSSRKRPKSPFNSISSKRSVPYSLTKNTGIDKNLPIINLVDSDDDIEIMDSDSSIELSNKASFASFGVQVSEKSPLTIKIIKKKPLTQQVITDITNKSEINDIDSVTQFNENIKNIDLYKDLDKTKNEYVKEDKIMQIESKGENLKKLKSTKNENNKGGMTKTSLPTDIFSRPTRIAVLVNKPKEALTVTNEPYRALDSNKILRVAVVDCSTSMISNVGSKCLKVVPEGRNNRQLTGSVKNPTYVNSVDRTMLVVNKLTEAAVDVIRKTPTPIARVHQPAIGYIPKPMITPVVKSNMKIKNSMNKCQNISNKTENIKNLEKSKIVATDHRRRPGTLSKTVRRYRRLNRTLSCESRGPAVPTFRDHGFAQGTIEQVVHGRFVTTIMTMSAAHTIASYLPPQSPRIPLDYASMYQHNVNVVPTENGNNNSNVDNNQNIKSSKTPVTLSAVMGCFERAVKIATNFACGNGHVWSGCARASGPTLMLLSKVTKEALSRNAAHQSRSTSSSQLTKAIKTPTTIPGRLSRSTRKKPISVVENSTKRSVSATVQASLIPNNIGKPQITFKRSTSLTSAVTPSSLESMTTSVVSTPSIKKAAELSSSPPLVGLHNRSKSALVLASASRKQQFKSEVQPTKRSASVAFSSAPLFPPEISTKIVAPALETKISTSSIEGRPHKRSKSAVTTTNTFTINVSPTFTKPGGREKCLGPVKRSASVVEYVSPSVTSKMSGSPPAIQPPKRSKSAVVITPVTEAAAASSNNFKQPRTVKRSASIALSPPSVGQTNKDKSTVSTSLSSNKKSNIQTGPTLANTSVPESRESRTLFNLKTMSPATPNDTKNNVFTNAVIETSDEDITAHEKTTTITEEEQRTVTVTRTLCPTIPAPMDVTADACTLVTAACEQFIKAMVMERHLKAGRGAGTLQLRRRDAFAAAIAVDDDIRPFPDYCRTPSIGATIVNPVTPAHGQGENNDVEKGPASEQKSIINDSRCNTKSIVMTIDKPDNVNERRAVSKQQSIIVDSKSKNELSVLTVKTVIETQTTSSTTTTINKLQCPTTITTVSAEKTRLLRSVVEGTSARTRGAVILKKTRSSASMPKTTMPSTSEQPTTGDQLSSDPTATGKRAKSLPPIIAPKTTVKPSSAVLEVTKTLPVLTPELLPDVTLTIKTSTSTRGFFVERGRPLLRPAFNRRQPFGTLVATCTMAAVDSTAVNNAYFSDDRGQDSDTKARWPNDNNCTDVWGCYFGNQQMLPPASRLSNFLNTSDEPKSTENCGKGDDTTHLIPSCESKKPPQGIRKADDNNAQEQMSLVSSRQQLMFMEIASQQQHMKQLEQEMKRRIQEYQNREPDSQEVYYQKFLKLQFGSTKTPPKLSLLRPPPNGHSRHSLMSW